MAWFIVPYRLRQRGERVIRYCAMDDYTRAIHAEKGAWDEIEIVGNQALVKVEAPTAVLNQIRRDLDFFEIINNLQDADPDTLNSIREKMQSLGYSDKEIQTTLGDDLSVVTQKQVVEFCAQRSQMGYYDAARGEVVLEQEKAATKPVDEVEKIVREAKR